MAPERRVSETDFETGHAPPPGFAVQHLIVHARSVLDRLREIARLVEITAPARGEIDLVEADQIDAAGERGDPGGNSVQVLLDRLSRFEKSAMRAETAVQVVGDYLDRWCGGELRIARSRGVAQDPRSRFRHASGRHEAVPE